MRKALRHGTTRIGARGQILRGVGHSRSTVADLHPEDESREQPVLLGFAGGRRIALEAFGNRVDLKDHQHRDQPDHHADHDLDQAESPLFAGSSARSLGIHQFCPTTPAVV